VANDEKHIRQFVAGEDIGNEGSDFVAMDLVAFCNDNAIRDDSATS
jgi:hypothetical protein